jgi:hypothetical protein
VGGIDDSFLMNIQSIVVVFQLMRKTKRLKSAKSHTFSTNMIAPTTMLCRGANVSLECRNFIPEWGLFRNAHGKIIEMIFDDGDDPNSGKQPRYVIVDFPGYTGPKWMSDHPPWVPIPTTTLCCEQCRQCTRTVVPLKLAYGCTIHTFQGNSVGPTKPGQPPNRFLRIVADPGKKSFEARSPGLSYTLTTRATTLGTQCDRMKSALFFAGQNMNKKRMINLTKNPKGEMCLKAKKREKWMERLQRNNKKCEMTNEEKISILDWGRCHTCDRQDLENIIATQSWRCPRDQMKLL